MKMDSKSNLIIINAKLVQKLGLKIRLTNTLVFHWLNMLVFIRDCIKF